MRKITTIISTCALCATIFIPVQAEEQSDITEYLTNITTIIEVKNKINQAKNVANVIKEKKSSVESEDPISSLALTEEKEGDSFPFTEPRDDVYTYCPSAIKEGDSYYILYTKTHYEGNAWQDYIYLRRTSKADGKWEYSREKLVLIPTEGSFDSHHVCDPSVIRGEFTYDGGKYTYMMAYLATTHKNAPACKNNEIGIALSNDLSHWVKTGKAVSYKTVSNPWGVGQPSVIKDRDNNPIIIYTGDNIQACSMDDDFIGKEVVSVSTKGTKNMHNADFATDGDYLYVIYDSNWSDPNVSNISNSAIIYRSEWNGTLSGLKSLHWENIDNINKEDTGYDWNHNAALTRDMDGNLAEDTAFVTKCDKYGANHEFSYRIFQWDFEK